jgi:hypothetical protein
MFLRLWQYVADLFLKWKIFHLKFVDKIKTQDLCFKIFFFFGKLCHLWDNVEKYGVANQDTDENIMRHVFLAFWITKTKHARARTYT